MGGGIAHPHATRESMPRSPIVAAGFAALLVGCSSSTYVVRAGTGPLSLRGNLVVTEPLFLADVDGTKTSVQRHEGASFVGFIYFSGGFVRLHKDQGVQISTKEIELKSSEEARSRATEMMRTLIAGALHDAQLGEPPPVSLKLEATDAPPVRKLMRFSPHREDGRDNISLPRYNIEFASGFGQQPLERLRQAAGKARYMLIPIITRHYGHTAGWFVGHDWGCDAGIRFGIAVTIVDLKDNRAVFHTEADRTVYFARRYSVNSAGYYAGMERAAVELRKLLADTLLSI